jgi:hypothetical protein
MSPWHAVDRLRVGKEWLKIKNLHLLLFLHLPLLLVLAI